MSDLLSVEGARRIILQSFHPVESTEVALEDAGGLVLARNIFSPHNFPAYVNSSMDGFAVLAVDLLKAKQDHPIQLEVIEDIPAGAIPSREIRSGQASRIMTGAMLPAGADSVIPVELTHEVPGSPFVLCYSPVHLGENIRPIGQDFAFGDQILSAGTQLFPHHLGLLASIGLGMIPVFRRPKIALLTTGDELVPVGADLEPGKIVDSNNIIISSLIKLSGGTVFNLGIARDDEAEIRFLLNQAIEAEVDAIISSAGVSVGNYDYVKRIVSEKGNIDFWRVNIRPGKPIAFGSYANIPFFGLPGNPVSSYVTFLIFVKPAIENLLGIEQPQAQKLSAILTESAVSDGRESYLRAKATLISSGEIHVKLSESHQGSGNLFGLVDANALLIVPSGVKSLPIGAQVKIILIGDLRDE